MDVKKEINGVEMLENMIETNNISIKLVLKQSGVVRENVKLVLAE